MVQQVAYPDIDLHPLPSMQEWLSAHATTACNYRQKFEGCGIVLCGGGYKYFTNAWLVIQLLRYHGCDLPIEFWACSKSEMEPVMLNLLLSEGVTVRFPDADFRPPTEPLPPGTRWQWALKPYSIINSRFAEVIFLDADCFPVRNPTDLFEAPPYREHGALFWPDIGMMDKDRPIWKMMGIPYRQEPEFETGQMVIDKRRCWEPLQLTLWMNQRADLFYQTIWGDKDTFRFAWHKFGKSFGMTPYPVQVLDAPGRQGLGVMCQHDFEGNWLFQHRNMAKWNLLSPNPRIPGYLFEYESRMFLRQLRSLWNGQVGRAKRKPPAMAGKQATEAAELRRELQRGVWLLEDRRPMSGVCCGPKIGWTDQRIPLPWTASEPSIVSTQTNRGLRCMELTFLPDSIGTGAQKDLYWWEARPGRRGQGWKLNLIGEEGATASLHQKKNGVWFGHWKSRAPGQPPMVVRLLRPEHVYPEKQTRNGITPSAATKMRTVHVANHAQGIGDAITGVYAVAGMVRAGLQVVYYTRHPAWLRRVKMPGLTITGDEPPAGAADLNADYSEQLRYAQEKAKWYAALALGNERFQDRTNGDSASIASSPLSPVRPPVDYALTHPVLDLSKYILLAPFASRASREWAEAHWRRLAFLLAEAGFDVVALGTKKDEERLRQTFDKSNAYWVVDQSPEWIMAAMLQAECVIGLDSAVVHLAGLLGVPAICVHSQLPPKFLFSCALSVDSVCPETNCRFCRWQEDKGYNEGCVGACSAIATITPERVAAQVSSPRRILLKGRLDKRVERHTQKAVREGARSRVVVNSPRADVIAYTYAPDCGLGEAAEMNIKAMREAGMVVEQRRWERNLVREMELADPQQIYYHHWHPQPHEVGRNWRLDGFTPGGAYHIAYWAYEIEEVLPPEFLDGAKVMSEIWTPSNFCQRLFETTTGMPVDVVPHAVSAKEILHELPSTDNKAPFTVLYLFDAWSRFARKNPTAAIRVFQSAFPNRHDVRLVLKGHHLNSEEAESLRAACGWDSRITVMNKFVSFAELEALFASADVLLSLQRGEGFGLNLARALGCGLPVITTGWGGHLDFCKSENSMLVPYHLQEVEREQDVFYKSGVWAEPNQKAATRMLVRVEKMVANRDPRLHIMRENGRSLIASQFSQMALNFRVAKKLQDLLVRLKAPGANYSAS